MHYTVYKITNKLNGKFYIGKHQTQDLNDGYMGSGKLLKYAIKKYGIENFSKEILHIFETEEEMNAKEKELVILSEDSYNLCEGGKGGFSYINKRLSKKEREQRAFKTNQTLNLKYGTSRSWQTAAAHKAGIEKLKVLRATGQVKNDNFKNKKHTLETRHKMSLRKKGKGLGKTNSQFGTFWITDGKVNKKCCGDIPRGFYKGRIFNGPGM